MSKRRVVNGVLTPIENTEEKPEKAVVARNPPGIGLTDPQWELIDPTPDIFAMFVQFDRRFFWNSLGRCEVKWSKRMTT
uniref:Transposase n=1 Tax=Steinernema glaseri TaxID=37863 RepID=A0A1I7YH07_9BILA